MNVKTIFDSRYSEETFNSFKEGWIEMKEDFEEDYNEDDYDMEMFGEDISIWLEDERANLSKQVDGTIVAYAKLGLWDGSHIGYKVIGNRFEDILQSYGSDDIHVFVDGYNVRANAYHHDGTNQLLFRLCDADKVDKVCQKIYGGCSEEQFMRMTKSLVDIPKKVYGW